ncbi:diacylglycerol/lipid kinase family protein [Streptomyces sp. NPDC002004]
MTTPACTLLVNPVSGRGAGARIAERVAERLRHHGVRPELVLTRTAGHAAEEARAAGARGGTLAVVGGDGMVNIAAQALAGTETALAVVPTGTGNDFARALGLPLRDPLAAADVVARGDIGTVDAAQVGDRWYLTVLTSGFDSRVTQRAENMRWPRGRLRYNIAAVAELSTLRTTPYVVTVDGQRIALDATLVAVGNTASYGGGMRICPAARPDDGRLSVTVVEAVDRRTFARVAPRVFTGTHVGHPAVRVYQGSEVSLEAPATTAYADGEPIAALPLTIRVRPGALRVVRPPRP